MYAENVDSLSSLMNIFFFQRGDYDKGNIGNSNTEDNCVHKGNISNTNIELMFNQKLSTPSNELKNKKDQYSLTKLTVKKYLPLPLSKSEDAEIAIAKLWANRLNTFKKDKRSLIQKIMSDIFVAD